MTAKGKAHFDVKNYVVDTVFLIGLNFLNHTFYLFFIQVVVLFETRRNLLCIEQKAVVLLGDSN